MSNYLIYHMPNTDGKRFGLLTRNEPGQSSVAPTKASWNNTLLLNAAALFHFVGPGGPQLCGAVLNLGFAFEKMSCCHARLACACVVKHGDFLSRNPLRIQAISHESSLTLPNYSALAMCWGDVCVPASCQCRYNPGDSGTFLQELQRAIEQDKAIMGGNELQVI